MADTPSTLGREPEDASGTSRSGSSSPSVPSGAKEPGAVGHRARKASSGPEGAISRPGGDKGPSEQRELLIDEIFNTEKTQARSVIDAATIESYSDSMSAGATFPPVTVFHDMDGFYLADGFHRLEAYRHLGKKHIMADVYEGTIDSAILYAAGANRTHGLRRTNEDKRRAVNMLLKSETWAGKSDNWIAHHCGVSQPFVSAQRKRDNGSKETESSGDRKLGKCACVHPKKAMKANGDSISADKTPVDSSDASEGGTPVDGISTRDDIDMDHEALSEQDRLEESHESDGSDQAAADIKLVRDLLLRLVDTRKRLLQATINVKDPKLTKLVADGIGDFDLESAISDAIQHVDMLIKENSHPAVARVVRKEQ